MTTYNKIFLTVLVAVSSLTNLSAMNGPIKRAKKVNQKELDRALIELVRNEGSVVEIQELIDQSADVNAKNVYGETAFMLAVKRGQLAVCKVLIENDADLNIRAEDGKTAIIWAVVTAHLAMCKLLIENGADVNVNNIGYTALFLAVLMGHFAMCKLLIENGAAFNIINNKQQSALSIAAKKGRTDLCKLIIENACLACPSKEEANVSRARFKEALLSLEKRGMHKDLWFKILSIAPEFKGGFIAVLYYDLCNGYAVGERFNLLSNKLYEYTIGELKKFMDRAFENIDDSNVELKSILDSTVLEENFGEVIRTNINERLGLMNAQAQEKIVKQEEL